MSKMKRKDYLAELAVLQEELVKLQYWVNQTGERVVILFEGRDASGKGGMIKTIHERLNPRSATIVALAKPTEQERTQWYFQRYIQHLPSAGEIVLFDRSWYNRAGVEKVFGFCTDAEYEEFLHTCPDFERTLVRSGIRLFKVWISVSEQEQRRRFEERVENPMKRWKLSPIDLESVKRWDDYSRAKDVMFARTHIPEAPWWVIEGDDKRTARLDLISHLLSRIPYTDVTPPEIELPEAPVTSYRPPAERHYSTVPSRHAEGDAD